MSQKLSMLRYGIWKSWSEKQSSENLFFNVGDFDVDIILNKSAFKKNVDVKSLRRLVCSFPRRNFEIAWS